MRPTALLVALFVGALSIWSSLPARGESPLPLPGDRTHGEEEAIRQRELWFYGRRAVGPESAALRAQAAVETRLRLAAERGNAPGGGLTWQPLGPSPMTMLSWTMGLVAGRIDALAVAPGDESLLYLGAAAGGIWKSTDGGASWTAVFDQVGTQTVGALTFSSGDTQTVWAGTGEHAGSCFGYFGMGVFRTTDGGATWEARNGSGASALALSFVSQIVVSPNDPNLVFASGHGVCNGGSQASGGIFRSTDAGASWQRVLTGQVNDLLLDPSAPNVMYAAVGRSASASHGVYKSTDGGLTWNQLPLAAWSPAPTDVSRIRLTMAGSDPQTLYVLANLRIGATSQSAIYKTTDGGGTWTRTNAGACEGQCSYNLTLDVHPTDPTQILWGTIRPQRSTDSGATGTFLTSGWGSGQKVHQDIHLVRYSRTDGNRYWIGGDGGLWRTDNGHLPPASMSFTNLNAGLNITQFYDVAVHPADPTTVFGGAQDNSSSRRSASEVWNVTTVTGDGFMNLVDPANPQIVFQTSYPSGGLPSLIKSDAGGAPNTFAWIATNGLTSGEPYPWVTPLAVFDLGSARPTYAFLGSNHLYRAPTDQPSGSFTWTKISANLTGNTARSVSSIHPLAAGGAIRLYVVTDNGRVHRTDDADSGTPTFSEVTGNLPAGQVLTDVAADAAAPDVVYVTVSRFGGNQLYRSSTAGGTWTAVGAGLPDLPVSTVAIDPLAPNRVFVGNDIGVFVSTDGGASFAPLMDGLPLGVPVTDLEVDDTPHVLVAGTYGRGAWRLDLDTLALFADGFETGDTAAWAATVP